MKREAKSPYFCQRQGRGCGRFPPQRHRPAAESAPPCPLQLCKRSRTPGAAAPPLQQLPGDERAARRCSDWCAGQAGADGQPAEPLLASAGVVLQISLLALGVGKEFRLAADVSEDPNFHFHVPCQKTSLLQLLLFSIPSSALFPLLCSDLFCSPTSSSAPPFPCCPLVPFSSCLTPLLLPPSFATRPLATCAFTADPWTCATGKEHHLHRGYCI